MQKNYKLLILSFFLLNLAVWITWVEVKYGIPKLVKYVLSVSVLGIIIFYWLRNPSKPVTGIWFYPVIMIFVLWSVIMLISAISGFSSISYLQLALADTYFFIPYLLPLILLFTKFELKFFGNLFYCSYILIIPAIIIQFYFILTGPSQENWLEQTNMIGIMDIGSFFLLLTAHFSEKRSISFLVLCYYLLWIILWSFYGRRGALVNNLLLLVFMVIIRLRSSFVKTYDRLRFFLSLLVLLMLFLVYGYLLTSSYAFQRGFSMSAFDESRGSVFSAFFYDFGASTSDWIFGRGINGTVLRSFISFDEFPIIENGFLTILLKGGLLYSIPFVLILLRASYLGFFRSNNDLVKALASYIFIYLIVMALFNLPSYSTNYILLWISVSACFTASLRNCSNEEVYQVINFRFR